MVPRAYAFRPMSALDLSLVRRWLAQPHVAQWWGDPDEQYALVSEDLNHPAMDQFIVAIGDRPFAYLQCYDPNAWPNNGLGNIRAAPAESISSSANPISLIAAMALRLSAASSIACSRRGRHAP